MAPPAPPSTEPGFEAIQGFVAWLCAKNPELLSSYAEETSDAKGLAYLRQFTKNTPPAAKTATTAANAVITAAKPANTVTKTAASTIAAKTATPTAVATNPAPKTPVSARDPRLNRSLHTSVPDSESEMDVDANANDGFTVVAARGKKRGIEKSGNAVNPTSPPSKSIAVSTSGTPKPASHPAPQVSVSKHMPPVNSRKERPPPPLFIQDKGKWEYVSSLLKTRGIIYTNARTTALGIKVQLGSSNDHRSTTRLLRHESISFHTYALEEERLLRVVLRGIPLEVSQESVLEDLKAQSLPVREVHRLHDRNRKPYSLFLVVLDRSPEGKCIFNVKTVVGLSGISIEAPHRNGIPSQCHRCQLYGHSARFCFARPRCVKCLGDHGTAECSRTRETPEPPSCVLCGTQGHTANYRGCPKAPRASAGRGPARHSMPLRHTRPSPQLTYVLCACSHYERLD